MVSQQTLLTQFVHLCFFLLFSNLIGESLNAVEIYEPAINKWLIGKPMTTPRSRVGVTVLNSRLYAIGGYDGQARLNTVEVFDPCSSEWWDVAPMNSRRRLVYMRYSEKSSYSRTSL